MSAVHESSLTAAPSSVPPTVSTSTTSAGAPVASSSVPATTATSTSTGHAAEDPVKALDHMAGEPSILDKAKGIAQPYLNKAQETTSPYIEKFVASTTPYLDNAAAKLEHLADRIEAKIDGTASSTGTASTTTLGDKSATTPTTTTAGVTGVTNPERRTSIVDQIGDKAQGVFASVSNTFSKLTSTIDDKTKSPTHPGIVTQLSQAVDKVSEKVDAYLDGAPAQHPAALEHPVQTTTNSVPHPTIPSDPSTSTSAATAPPSSGAASHTAASSSSNTAAPSSSAPAAPTGSSGSNGGSSSNEPKVDPNVDSRF